MLSTSTYVPSCLSTSMSNEIRYYEYEYQVLRPQPWFPSPMTLTLDFQGQILKKPFLRNGMADWHGMKEMWVDRMLDSFCDFQCLPHPWLWPLIFKVKFCKCYISGMGWPIDMERKGCELIGYYTHFVTFNILPKPWPWPWIFKVEFWKSCISGMGWLIDMERKGCESIEC